MTASGPIQPELRTATIKNIQTLMDQARKKQGLKLWFCLVSRQLSLLLHSLNILENLNPNT